MKKDVRVLIVFFALLFASLACGLFGPPPEGYANWDQWETQQAVISTMESLQVKSGATQSASDAEVARSVAAENYAQATAAINNSSDSPQGGVNIYLQGHRDGEQEGLEDAGYETTINRQKNAIEGWKLAALAFLAALVGGGFLNAMTRR